MSGASLGAISSCEILGAAISRPTFSTNCTSMGGVRSFSGLGAPRKLADSTPNSRTCPAVAMPKPIFSARSMDGATLLLVGRAGADKRHAIQSGAVQLAHHLHHLTVIQPTVGPQIDLWALLRVAFGFADVLDTLGPVRDRKSVVSGKSWSA